MCFTDSQESHLAWNQAVGRTLKLQGAWENMSYPVVSLFAEEQKLLVKAVAQRGLGEGDKMVKMPAALVWLLSLFFWRARTVTDEWEGTMLKPQCNT